MARVLSKGRKKLAFIPKTLAPTAAAARSLTVLNGAGAGVLYASDYALADGFQLGFGEPATADATPIGSSRTVSVVGEGELVANINFARDTAEADDEAWIFHQTIDVPFWAVLRDGPGLATTAWAVDDEVDVFDLSTTDPNPRQDAEVWSFNVVYGQGVGHERRVKVTAGA
jgi:hypothetical protein